MKEVGRIIGTTSLGKYIFAVVKEGEEFVKKDEFVSAIEPITGNEVVGTIREVTASNQLLPDEFARESAMSDFVGSYGLDDGEYIVGIVDVLGPLENDKIGISRHSLRPATPVTLTNDKTIEKLLTISKDRAMSIGTVATRKNVEVPLDVNKLVSSHCAILAMTGAGKSYTGGVIIEEMLKKGGAIVVFDPHGEYKYLGYKSDGSKSEIIDQVKVYGVGRGAENKLRLKASHLSAEDIASLAAGTTDPQKDLLYEIIEFCTRKKRDYTLNDMIEVLHMIIERKNNTDNGDEVIGASLDAHLQKLSKKAHISTTSALIRRLESLKRSGLISSKETPLEDLISTNQVTVIDLSGTPESIKEMVVSAIARKIFYARINFVNDYLGDKLGIPCFMVMEEAHNFVPRDFERIIVSRSIIRRIAREGRKFGVGLCLISQRPSRLDQDVLSQCNTQIIMKIVNPLDQDFIRKSAESVTEDIIRDLPGLGRGEAVITGSAIKFPMHTKIKERDTKAGGDDIDVISAWNPK